MSAESWLRVTFAAGAIVDACAAIGMWFPTRLGARMRFNTATFAVDGTEFRYAMRFGAPLMAGWTVLLIWGDADPVARRALLLFTIIPVVAGFIANDLDARRRGHLIAAPALLIRVLQLSLVGLFTFAYVNSL